MNPGFLTDLQTATVTTILAGHAGRYQSVAIFGSRAVGGARKGSDLDLVFYGADETVCADLVTAFIESDLSIEVDLVDYDRLESAALRARIDRDRIRLRPESWLEPGVQPLVSIGSS